jgi:hypothetical protein
VTGFVKLLSFRTTTIVTLNNNLIVGATAAVSRLMQCTRASATRLTHDQVTWALTFSSLIRGPGRAANSAGVYLPGRAADTADVRRAVGATNAAFVCIAGITFTFAIPWIYRPICARDGRASTRTAGIDVVRRTANTASILLAGVAAYPTARALADWTFAETSSLIDRTSLTADSGTNTGTADIDLIRTAANTIGIELSVRTAQAAAVMIAGPAVADTTGPGIRICSVQTSGSIICRTAAATADINRIRWAANAAGINIARMVAANAVLSVFAGIATHTVGVALTGGTAEAAAVGFADRTALAVTHFLPIAAIAVARIPVLLDCSSGTAERIGRRTDTGAALPDKRGRAAGTIRIGRPCRTAHTARVSCSVRTATYTSAPRFRCGSSDTRWAGNTFQCLIIEY